jgi:alkylation response protein AidB-like acyl-CoA dehydrogenase
MDFRLDDEQELISKTIRRFSDNEISEWAAESDRTGEPPPRLFAMASDLGFLIDAVPEAAGGMREGAYSHFLRALRAYELARGCPALAALLECNVEPALAVDRWGSDAAKQALFGCLADGGLAATAADWAGHVAVRVEGQGVILDGTIGPVPALGQASHLLLCVRAGVADGKGEPFLLLCAADQAAIEPQVPSGWRAARWAKARFAATRIGADFVLARGPAAEQACAEVLAWYRLNLAARAAGLAAAALAHAARYGQERVQFDQPIGTFQSIAGLQDRGETDVEAARLLVLQAAWKLDAGSADAGEAVSRARDFSARTVREATIDAVQIYGGYGFVNDFPVEKTMRDARAFEVLTGNEAFLRVLARGPAQAR